MVDNYQTYQVKVYPFENMQGSIRSPSANSLKKFTYSHNIHSLIIILLMLKMDSDEGRII